MQRSTSRKRFKRSHGGAAIGSVISVVAVVLIIAVGFLYTFCIVVPPGYMGLRQTYFGPWAGFATTADYPGIHLTVPYVTRVHLLPATVQAHHFVKDEGQSFGNVKTADGALVDIDMTVFTRLYRSPGVVDGVPHGGPADVIRQLSLDPRRWQEQIRSVIESQTRNYLSNLLASTFYDPAEREKYMEPAKAEMKKRLAPFGIDVEEVLLRRYTYQNRRIDDAIFQKNLQDQEVRLNEAAGRLAAAKAKLDQVEAEWDAKIATLKILGENQGKVMRSEANLYEGQQFARGDLEVAKARAEVDQRRADALSAAGSDIYIARKLSPLVSSLKGGVVTNLDPYNVDDWIKRLGVTEK